MAANDPHPRSDRLPPRGVDISTPAALRERLVEEISRAERHDSPLSCLLIVIDNLDELSHEHGSELREETLGYVAQALRRELRRFDRIGRAHDGADLLVILPGADSARGEIVARRALERLNTIKIEAAGARRPLQVSVGLAAWRESLDAEALLASARGALRRINGDEPHAAFESQTPEPHDPADAAIAPAHDAPGGSPPAFGRARSS
jgi:diguanylate cyclase (GGDEF)-like protein